MPATGNPHPAWLPALPPWPTTPHAARAVQITLAPVAIIRDNFSQPIRTLAATDLAIDVAANEAIAGVILYEFPSLNKITEHVVRAPLRFPYISGLLAFREIPPLHAVLAQLPQKPDLLIMDGQGIAHPKRCGLATHLGMLLDLPTIGCAKSLLVGAWEETALTATAGTHTPLTHKQEQIGWVLRTKKNCRPIFISPGHRVSLPTALAVIQQCCDSYRIPKPTREADQLVARWKHRTQ